MGEHEGGCCHHRSSGLGQDIAAWRFTTGPAVPRAWPDEIPPVAAVGGLVASLRPLGMTGQVNGRPYDPGLGKLILAGFSCAAAAGVQTCGNG